jgi:hypothetical protein
MSRKVEGLENLNRILELPLGSMNELNNALLIFRK